MAAAAAASASPDPTQVRRELPVLPLEQLGRATAPLPFGAFSVEESARHIVDGIPIDRSIVLLGESTHGTAEYYKTRAEISKKLIEERGFSVVVFEADFPFMERVNHYVHRRVAEPFPPEKERKFPPWMWCNKEAEEFFEWCKKKAPSTMDRGANPNNNNTGTSSLLAKQIDLFGMDVYDFQGAKDNLLLFLRTFAHTDEDKAFCAEVTARLGFLDKFKSGFDYADAVVNGSLRHVQQHLQDCLTKIQARLSWGSTDKYKCSALERLSAECNLEVLIAADEYYRKCVSEPAGSQASWNIRDQAMTLTLMKIRAHFGDKTKVIVWAHNSHIGDSTATRRGGVDFTKNETWNLGQMVRSTFGADQTWIVGQYTFAGTVVAAPNWGQPHREVPLNDALPGSYEELLHRTVFLPFIKEHPVSRNPELYGKTSFFFSTMPFADPHGRSAASGDSGSAASSNEAGAAVVRQALAAQDPIAQALYNILRIDDEDAASSAASSPNNNNSSSKTAAMRLQRWVGVSYKPETERQSHYGEMCLARCYDQVVFVDRTRGVGPLRTAEEKQADAAVDRDAATGQQQQVSAATMKRLMKEYKSLLQDPPHGIEAHPLENNILEWHFRFTGFDGSPYEGGEYHGIVEFKPGYPHRAPAFRMLTPSGRFECGESICTSASVWHESEAGGWNPTWCVSTILVGLHSFFREESNGIGSIRMSAVERKRLAQESHAFNMRNAIFRQLFCSGDDKNKGKFAAEDDAAAAGGSKAATESVCRICLSADGALISPCGCTGTNQFVHLECLREWQRQVLLQEHTHPKYRNTADTVCSVCLQPFTGEGIPPSRHEQIVKYAGGAEISKLIAPGNLLVSSREKSVEYKQLMISHPEVKRNLAPWTCAVFLILQSSREHMLGVSMSMPAESPADAGGSGGLLNRAAWALRLQRAKARGLRYQCWSGGPVHTDVLIPVVHLPNARDVAAAAQRKSKDSKIQFVPPCFLCSFSLDEMEALCSEQFAERKKAFDALPAGTKAETPPPEEILLNVCVGCAGWSGTQVLAEIARGGWGLVSAQNWLQIRPDPDAEIVWRDDFKWERVMPLAVLAPKTEYSR